MNTESRRYESPSSEFLVNSLTVLSAVLALLLSTGSLSGGSVAREDVIIYECSRLPKPPRIDGVLNDPAWKLAPVSEIPYKFLAQRAIPAKSNSTFQLGFDERALYLNAVFYREPGVPLKQNYFSRDHPDLWMDDSTEIYFDPDNDGRFFKFIVNSAGVVTDLKLTNRGIDYSWDANEAEIKVNVDEKNGSLK